MHVALPESRLRSDLNVTPLVDIVLVLLIIFIVLTPVVSGAVLLPRAEHGRRGEDRPFTLVLGQQDGRPFVSLDEARAERLGLEPTSLAKLGAPLGRALDRGDSLHLKVDRGLSYGPLNTLLTFCRAAGAESAELVVDSHPEGGLK